MSHRFADCFAGERKRLIDAESVAALFGVNLDEQDEGEEAYREHEQPY